MGHKTNILPPQDHFTAEWKSGLTEDEHISYKIEMASLSDQTDPVSEMEPDGSTFAAFLEFLGPGGTILKWLRKCNHMVQDPDGTVQLILRSRQIYQDQGGPGHILVVCDAYNNVGDPTSSNSRHAATKTLNHPDVVSEKPWFQMDQYFMFLIGGCTGHQGPRTWDFKNAIPDKAKVDSAIQEISQGLALAGIQCDSPSTIFLADHNMWIARFRVQGGFASRISTIPDEVSATRHIEQDASSPIVFNMDTDSVKRLKKMTARDNERGGSGFTFSTLADKLCAARPKVELDGTFLGDNMCIVRHLVTTAAKKRKLEVVDPTMIPGFLPGAVICIMFSTQSMRNGSTGYEACIVAVDKLEMWNALSGECNIEVKILPCYNARIEGDDGKRKPSGYVIEIKMPPSHDMDPYIITSKIAEAVLLWKPTVREILTAKSRTNPFLRAVRSTWKKLKRFWTCSCSASA